ncbi:MAG: LOG family protein [Candidatus Omnitrophica bacterium]|nr:LOG family protein [Candidatus Omnitrophota bacterium]
MNKKNKPNWLIKAYDNYAFLNSPQARTIRVLAELLEPAARFHKYRVKNTIVFFGSARLTSREESLKNLRNLGKKIKQLPKPSKKAQTEYENAKQMLYMSKYYEDAVKLSEKLTLWFRELQKKGEYYFVCSGGGPGIMEAANKGALNAHGESLGFNISLPTEQTPNIYQTKELAFDFHYFFIRKFWFFYLAKGLVVFPGGYGTMDELFEILTLVQTEKTSKRMAIVLYGKEYWNEVINFNALVKWNVISKKDLKLFKVFDNVESAYSFLKGEITKNYLKKSK